ncbi:MAG TPA: cyclic nucleotide-binding domain-containing protein [Stellaceae bacterium]|nr:cyclic nucleotide-binding domain-containing protein [Stellaceae bacterium]
MVGIRGLDSLICEHPLFAGMAPDYCELIGGCARNVRFAKGEYLFREGEPADQFFLVRHGRVALELMAPGRGPIRFLTVNAGEIAGVSWLVPPYRWLYDARALELTRAVAIDAACLRRKAEENHDFGYEMTKRFMAMLVQRLHAAQLQILDVYGTHG